MSEVVAGAVPLHLEVRGDAGAPADARPGAGREPPTVVLMHGFGGSARNWRPQQRALAPPAGPYRVAAFDLRGHARSAVPPAAEDYRPACFVADVVRVLDHLGVDRAVVGGLSMGAGIALRFALAHPGRTLALVLAAFPPGAGQGRQRDWALGFADAIERDGLEAAGARFAWGPEAGLDPAAAQLVRQGFLEHPPHAIAHTLRELLAVQPSPDALAPALAGLDLPALVVVGARDPVSRRASEAVARALPRGVLHVVPGAGHVVNLEARAAFDAALRGFLDSLPSSPGGA
jgi:pimeloyl-ACP methyl ester carboxylesterase